MKNATRVYVVMWTCIVFMLNTCVPSFSWGLKTHIWIAQQVINDAEDDGRLQFGANSYPLSPTLLVAITQNSDRFRLGNMGPDVFPDPIVGQTTTHPGVENGWQTDQWLAHLYGSSGSDPQRLATAAGFVSHAAGDIFAHSYVNNYAGDIFILTDDERDVERRHFVLEKYIEGLTPLPTNPTGGGIHWGDGLGVDAEFLRDALIFNSDASRQNAKAGTGLHLTAMKEVRDAVEGADKETQKVISQITDFAADIFKKQIDLQIDLTTGKATIDAAKLSLDVAEEALKVKRQIHEAALGALAEARNIVIKNPELITHQTAILAEQLKILADAVVAATKVASDVLGEIEKLDRFVGGLLDDLGDLTCDIIGGVLPECKELRQKISNLRGRISHLRALKAAADEARNIAQKNVDGTKRLIDDLQKAHNEATIGLANGTYEAAVLASETELRLQERTVAGAKEAVRVAEELQEKVSNELKKVTDVVDKIKEALDRFNPITLFLRNWLGDIDDATTKYIEASDRAGRKMLLNNGNPLSDYQDWLGCYGGVYAGVPIEIGNVTCEVKHTIQELRQKFDDAIAGLPEILQWALFPAQTAKKKVLEKLEPELEKAGFELLKVITDPATAELLQLLSNPEMATRSKLEEVFSQDESGKHLLIFPAMGSLVDKDIGLANGVLNVETFAPLHHAVTLAKLAMLEEAQINQMIRDFAPGYISPLFGDPVYTTGKPSILFSAVRSIDGNHQWQGYGLPYPRALGTAHGKPSQFPYGHDYWQNNANGLRIWVDPYLREKVFLRLFTNPIIGSINDRPELAADNYRFVTCNANPFPRTQDAQTGALLNRDTTCLELQNPDQPPVLSEVETPEEYRKIFFQCDVPMTGNRHWTIAASYKKQATAEKHAAAINQRYPDLAAEAWRPGAGNAFWTVMLAACTTKDVAITAREMAIRRGIANDAFVWESRPPWGPIN